MQQLILTFDNEHARQFVIDMLSEIEFEHDISFSVRRIDPPHYAIESLINEDINS